MILRTSPRRAAGVLLAVLALVSVAAGCSIPGSQVRNGRGIVGTYTLNGVDPNRVEYAGTVVITATSRSDVYSMQWIVTEAIDEGTATLNGDELTVDWHSVTTPHGKISGTAAYVLSPSGDLTGTKTTDGFTGHAKETIYQKA